MDETKNKLKIVFAPGSFDDFDGTQEELDELVKSITDYLGSADFQEALEDADEDVFDETQDIFQSFNYVGNQTIH